MLSGMIPQEILQRRRAPCFAYLSEALEIICAEAAFFGLCAAAGYPCATGNRLHSELECAVRGLTAASPSGGRSMHRSLLLRAVQLQGFGGPHIAVCVESVGRRAPQQRAAERFHLTPRETAVLELILQGLCARDIAARLQIAQATVGEYFKHLCTKIDAHNRAQMIARVFEHSL
jgi:DNA-binding CsgD family transcriptional regulator